MKLSLNDMLVREAVATALRIEKKQKGGAGGRRRTEEGFAADYDGMEEEKDGFRELVAGCDLQCNSLAETLLEVVTEDATLCELSSLHSFPGARQQSAHCDTTEAERSIVTAFLALQDIRGLDMGPTILFPRSHLRPSGVTADAHARDLSEAAEATLSSVRTCVSATDSAASSHSSPTMPVAPLLRAGSALVMDSRLVHYGGANFSDRGLQPKQKRVLLYMSWMLPTGAHAGNGSTLSLLPEYGGGRNRRLFRLGSCYERLTSKGFAAPNTQWDELAQARAAPASSSGMGGGTGEVDEAVERDEATRDLGVWAAEKGKVETQKRLGRKQMTIPTSKAMEDTPEPLPFLGAAESTTRRETWE